jgi:hypothetical protein
VTSKLYLDARCFTDAIEAAARDRTSWPAKDRAALGRIVDHGIAPVIRMRRRWFCPTEFYTFVVERPRGGGFTVVRLPTN